MLNSYHQFADLVGQPKIDVVKVLSHNGDGSITVETLNGKAFRAVGEKVAVNSNAYCDITSRRIIGQAPSLPVVPVTLF